MKKNILTWGLLLVSLPVLSQAIIANPQNTDKEGGELVLMNSSSLYNPWNIDNYAGNLRFFHSGSEYFNMLPNGNLGIGTPNPTDRLHVNGTARVGDGNHGALIVDGIGANDWLLNAHNGGTLFGIRTQRDGEAAWSHQVMTLVRSTGNVGIGSIYPDSKLTVKGKIHAEEVKVDLSVPGPDYVFAHDYDLPSLKELQKYISENKHLPNIPSAAEMEANGVELGIMNMKLLEKIEELVLYTLEQENKLQQQHAINQEQKIINRQLEERLKRLESLLSKQNKTD